MAYLGGTPVSEFPTRTFFTLSFPTLFENKNGDYYMNRLRTCTSMSDWRDHLMWYKDGRFAKHPYFKFIVHNMIMRKRTLEMSSFVVKQKLEEAHYSIEEDRTNQGGDRSLAEKLLYFSAPLGGTSQYWAQHSKELRSLNMKSIVKTVSLLSSQQIAVLIITLSDDVFFIITSL